MKHETKTKRCSRCRQQVEISLFPKDASRKGGLSGLCRPCAKIVLSEVRARQRAHPNYEKFRKEQLVKTRARRKAFSLRVNYGIDLKEYEALYAAQNGQCAICGCVGGPAPRNKEVLILNVDHDHTTGKVRGLLCRACNQGLGLFRDSLQNLESAITYLKRQ